jgi:hypothetical protein
LTLTEIEGSKPVVAEFQGEFMTIEKKINEFDKNVDVEENNQKGSFFL